MDKPYIHLKKYISLTYFVFDILDISYGKMDLNDLNTWITEI